MIKKKIIAENTKRRHHNFIRNRRTIYDYRYHTKKQTNKHAVFVYINNYLNILLRKVYEKIILKLLFL